MLLDEVRHPVRCARQPRGTRLAGRDQATTKEHHIAGTVLSGFLRRSFGARTDTAR
jgi:hypothetical protein